VVTPNSSTRIRNCWSSFSSSRWPHVSKYATEYLPVSETTDSKYAVIGKEIRSLRVTTYTPLTIRRVRQCLFNGRPIHNQQSDRDYTERAAPYSYTMSTVSVAQVARHWCRNGVAPLVWCLTQYFLYVSRPDHVHSLLIMLFATHVRLSWNCLRQQNKSKSFQRRQ